MTGLASHTTGRFLPKHIPELDGIRGLAILLVLAYHYVGVPIPSDAGKGLAFIRQLLSNGWSGVDLFFVLSGFLIAGILIDNRSADNYFRVFYTRRISRIFPLYYSFLIVFVLLRAIAPKVGFLDSSLFSDALPLLPYFVYVQNFVMAVRGTFGNEILAVTWSLAIEEHFYLFLPWFVRRSRPSRLAINLIFLIGITLILRTFLGGGTFIGFVVTPWRLDSLLLGALLALVFRAPRAVDWVRSNLRWIKAGFGVLALFFIYSSIFEPFGSLDHLFAFGLLYAGLITLALANQAGLLARFFRQPLLMSVGRISYGIYILHQFVNGIIHSLLFKSVPSFHNPATALATCLALAVTYLLALGSFHLFEKRFIAFGHSFHYAVSQAGAEARSQR